MKILLASLGTAGDVHPFLAIGRALAARGHSVQLVSNPVFAPLAAAAGIGFRAVGRAEQYHAAFSHRYIWHSLNGFGVMWRYLARPALPEAYACLAAAHAEGPCAVLYSPFLMPAARIAEEALGLRAIPAYTAPAMLPNFAPPLCLTRWRIPRGVPRGLARRAVEMLDRRKMQPLALPAIEAVRAPLGLPPLTESIFLRWLHASSGITLFPAWFAARSPDWPAHLRQAGFPLWDGDAAQGLAPQIEQFLARGEPPLLFTAGTAMTQAGEFMARAVRVSRKLGARAILLSADAAQVPAGLPPGILHASYAPFSLLLPRARALIHHGGIGSCAQALRAGIPQLVLPHAYDQFDNAMRLQQLGAGGSVSAGCSDRALRRALRDLLDSARVRAGCALARARIRLDDPLGAIVSAVENGS